MMQNLLKFSEGPDWAQSPKAGGAGQATTFGGAAVTTQQVTFAKGAL
jgi:hypothetical protein